MGWVAYKWLGWVAYKRLGWVAYKRLGWVAYKRLGWVAYKRLGWVAYNKWLEPKLTLSPLGPRISSGSGVTKDPAGPGNPMPASPWGNEDMNIYFWTAMKCLKIYYEVVYKWKCFGCRYGFSNGQGSGERVWWHEVEMFSFFYFLILYFIYR